MVNMAKRRRFRRYRAYVAKHRYSGKRKLPGAIMIGAIAMPGVQGMINSAVAGDISQFLIYAKSTIGINTNNQFDTGLFFRNMTPLLIGTGVHKAASMFGINRALSKVPWIQV